MPSKDISVKNLAGIIQARMSEILSFVTFHLKQVGLDSKMLNGGIVLTGGGAQLKHLIQLTEYATGLNARIGLPNEHLAVNHFPGLEKPMYSTCIGLILKGYSVYENNLNRVYIEQKRAAIKTPDLKPEVEEVVEKGSEEKIQGRKTLSHFMNSIKDGLIDLFKEDSDRTLEGTK
jgi:cell division protein FtsA